MEDKRMNKRSSKYMKTSAIWSTNIHLLNHGRDSCEYHSADEPGPGPGPQSGLSPRSDYRGFKGFGSDCGWSVSEDETKAMWMN